MDRDRFRTKTDNEESPVRPQPALLTRPHPQSTRPPAPQPAPASIEPIAVPPPVEAEPPTPEPATEPEPVAPSPIASLETMDFPPIIIEDEAAAGPSTKSRLVKRLAIAGVSLAVVAVAAGAGYNFLRSSAGATSTAELGALKSTLNTGKSSAASSGVTVAGAMPFSPIVPYGKPTLAKLGNSAYNSQYNSYTFDDTYMNKELRVSEQPLPSGVDSAAPLIDKITASLQAGSKQPVTTNNGQPAYLLANTSVANKQVVVFTTRDMLFFVQSATPHDAIGWTAYLNSFQ